VHTFSGKLWVQPVPKPSRLVQVGKKPFALASHSVPL
jgi:hypothetical protein